ncbi:MAG: AAA family ATPase [Candidatus Saccharimonas aalborgensis]
MEDLTFDYYHSRAAEARLRVRLEGAPIIVIIVIGTILFALGVLLLFLASPLGWTCIGLVAVPAMLVWWYLHGLRHIPSAHHGGVEAWLSSDILGRLPKRPTPLDIATAVGQVNSGLFMGVRLGLTPRLLQQIASKEEKDTAEFWKQAESVRKQNSIDHLSGSVLAVALIRSFPAYQDILAQIHLDDEDLDDGIRWQDHLRKLVQKHSRARRTGGIGRDWTFGYIPLLTKFGQNISEQIGNGSGLLTVDIDSHTRAIDQLIETFGTGGRQNAALVGVAGAGKTTIIHAFAERLLDASAKLPDTLKFRQVFILDSASLIAAAPGRGELESLIMRVLGEAYSAKNIIVCLDNAQLFFEEGMGSVDLTNVLLPILDAGRLRVILSMDEQRFLKIGQRNPSLINALNRINVEPADEDETLVVMQEQLILTEIQRNVTYMYQALKEAYRLSERYVHDLAMPGRALKLLESAAAYSESGIVTINSVQQAIEKTIGVKISVASDTEDRERLLHMETLIHERMVNQSRAVSVVSDALRRARAGVRNQNRPIGTFLFLGPTGVGKTELSKALAAVYFNGEERMIRIDLNEYVRAEDVSRLIADGADDPSSLTAEVMKQPFSVVLLDEIEKAAPEVLTTLLQLLDEGILRDIKNREVSFRDAIIIATSNAGAERIREYIGRGYQLEQFEEQLIDELINTRQFRPEFLNRFDEIVVFRPFTKDELLQVFDLILANVNKTLALQKISVEVSDEAKRFLVEKGYDPRLGARPMRRVVQKAVESTVAKQMLSGLVGPGSTISLSLSQVEEVFRSENEVIAMRGESQAETQGEKE